MKILLSFIILNMGIAQDTTEVKIVVDPAISTEFTQDEKKENLATDEFTFRADVTIDSGEVSKTNMRIIGGDLTVFGTVNGKITLFGGDATLKNGSVLNGEIITIGGNVYREPKSMVNGIF